MCFGAGRAVISPVDIIHYNRGFANCQYIFCKFSKIFCRAVKFFGLRALGVARLWALCGALGGGVGLGVSLGASGCLWVSGCRCAALGVVWCCCGGCVWEGACSLCHIVTLWRRGGYDDAPKAAGRTAGRLRRACLASSALHFGGRFRAVLCTLVAVRVCGCNSAFAGKAELMNIGRGDSFGGCAGGGFTFSASTRQPQNPSVPLHYHVHQNLKMLFFSLNDVYRTFLPEAFRGLRQKEFRATSITLTPKF